MRAASIVLAAVVLLGASAPGQARTTAPARTPAFTVPFIEDDYARALTSARAKKVPIFVEAWAPW